MFLHYLLLREVPLGVIVERMPVHFGVTPGINLQPPETRDLQKEGKLIEIFHSGNRFDLAFLRWNRCHVVGLEASSGSDSISVLRYM